jgi:hypothetical protein
MASSVCHPLAAHTPSSLNGPRSICLKLVEVIGADGSFLAKYLVRSEAMSVPS